MSAPRKHTKFMPCPNHVGVFAGESRERKAEIFGEGGPYHAAPCAETPCRIAPGRDLFVASLCSDTYDVWTDGPFKWEISS